MIASTVHTVYAFLVPQFMHDEYLVQCLAEMVEFTIA
jgi:hypothetical protein